MPLNREGIISIATPHFLKHGYEGISMNQLLKLIGMSKGGYYHHFANKEELAIGVAESLYSHQFDALGEILDTDTTVKCKFDLIKQLIETIVDQVDEVVLIGNYKFLFDMNNNSKKIYEMNKLMYENIHVQLTKMLKHGIESGELSEDIDCENHATVLITGIEGLLLTSIYLHTNVTKSVETLFKTHYSYIRKEG